MTCVPRTPRFAPLLTSLSLGLALAGCSGSSGTDNGVVVITEPSKITGAGAGTAAPATDGAPAAAAPTETATSAAPSAPPSTASGWGTLKGRVVFSGNVPQRAVLVGPGMDLTKIKDPTVCAVQDVLDEKLIVDPETKGVKNVLVYIPRPSAVNPDAEAAALAAKIDFDQHNCVFVPHVLAAMKGATINVKSSDAAGHNVHTNLRGTAFNQGIQPGSNVPIVIKTPDNRPGQVVCDIHGWMKAWWLTLGNPYFAVTNDKGEFEIKNVPAGDQKVVVWAEALHPAFVTSSGTGDPVNIKADGETTVEYTVDGSKVK